MAMCVDNASVALKEQRVGSVKVGPKKRIELPQKLRTVLLSSVVDPLPMQGLGPTHLRAD